MLRYNVAMAFREATVTSVYIHRHQELMLGLCCEDDAVWRAVTEAVCGARRLRITCDAALVMVQERSTTSTCKCGAF